MRNCFAPSRKSLQPRGKHLRWVAAAAQRMGRIVTGQSFRVSESQSPKVSRFQGQELDAETGDLKSLFGQSSFGQASSA